MKKVKAKIYLYKHKGRTTPFISGYKPAFNFGDNNSFITGKIELIDMDKFLKGMLGEVYIYFNDTNNVVSEGKTFSINEPPIEIGEGEVLEIIK